MNLQQFNALSPGEASTLLQQCNASENWSKTVAAGRPYADTAAIKEAAARIWNSLGEKDYLEAFEAHPMIGDVNSLRQKYASTKALASGEQSGAAGADDAVLQELSDLNHKYLEKFGFIFIVFATGKSAQEMLALLKARIGNTRSEEIANAAAEQLKITLLRIDKFLGVA